jgi:alpha-glucosidase (family GH31 glycosyl hydrolase)
MLRRLLVETDYDGWMQDFGELTPADAVFADGRSGWEIRNHYPTLYHQAAAAVVRRDKPDAVFFVRSGAPGSNQWAPAAWPGDQHCDWSSDRGLPGVIPAGLSVGICGVNTWGPDIGGMFDAGDDGASARSRELWIRWCQFGALTPIMRDHLGAKRMTIPTWRRYAQLHNALVPYLYAYARLAHEAGIPTMRHLVLHYPDDGEAVRQDHEYLLGEELLVAPVVEAGARRRRVYLPAGQWHSFWNDAVLAGPGYHEVPAPLEQLPLFVRGGAVLPLLGQPVETLATRPPHELLRTLQLRVYPSGAAARSSQLRFHDDSSVQLTETDSSLTLDLLGGEA